MWITFGLFVITLFFIFVPSINTHMMAQKKESIHELANSAWSLLFDFHERVNKGEFSLEVAQSRAAEQIRNMRYGPEGKDYFWINDMHPKMIMHPYLTSLEGHDLTPYADPNGKHLFVDSVRIVVKKNEGYIDYFWQWKDDPDRVLEKLSYVKGFLPWGWVIGTGIYIEDVKHEIDRIMKDLTHLFTGLLLVILIISCYISFQAVKSEKKRTEAEESLRESEERYRLLAENATDNIWILQLSSYKLSYVSPSIITVLGYTPKEMQDLEFQDYLPEDMIQKVFNVIAEEIEQEGKPGIDPKRTRTIQVEEIKKDGYQIWVEIKACFLRNDEGIPDRVLGITRDITARKRLEGQLKQSHKMEAIGTLAGGIAHDFNNILSSIMGFTELAKMATREDDMIQDNLDQVLSAGIRARDLVKHIMAFSRQSETKTESVSLTPLIKECLKFIRASVPKNINIRHSIKDSHLKVMADPSQLHQMMMNLCTNAAHSMKEKGGTLEFRHKAVDIHDTETLQLKSLKKGTYLNLTIADTGSGIPKEITDKIFDPFFTTKKRGEGTGMGLSTVHGIVKAMEGQISVYTELGKGTTFQIFIPVYDTALSDEKEKSLATEKLTPGHGRILLVDDESSIVASAKLILESLGYDVVGVTSSVEALELFKFNPDSFDLVLTDLTMPDMSGIQLSKEILLIKPGIPVILCTGFSEGHTSQSVHDIGIFDMIMKPIISSELSDIVNRALHQKQE